MCSLAENHFFGRASSAVHDRRSPLETRVDLLAPRIETPSRSKLPAESVSQHIERRNYSTQFVTRPNDQNGLTFRDIEHF